MSCGDEVRNGEEEIDSRPSPSVVYMWIGKSYNGDLGGISGADSKCEERSSGETFATEVDTHRVVLSSSTQDVRNFFSNNPPLQRPDGTPIMAGYTDFFNPSQEAQNPIRAQSTNQWTGISNTGAPSSLNCNDWTSGSSAEHGSIGGDDVKNSLRFHIPALVRCSETSTLLCISY